jgi:hypothetical protein
MSKKTKKVVVPVVIASNTLVAFDGNDVTLKAVHSTIVAASQELLTAKELGVTDRVRNIIVANLERCANQIARAGRVCRSPEKKAADAFLKQIEKARAAGVDVSALLR